MPIRNYTRTAAPYEWRVGTPTSNSITIPSSAINTYQIPSSGWSPWSGYLTADQLNQYAIDQLNQHQITIDPDWFAKVMPTRPTDEEPNNQEEDLEETEELKEFLNSMKVV